MGWKSHLESVVAMHNTSTGLPFNKDLDSAAFSPWYDCILRARILVKKWQERLKYFDFPVNTDTLTEKN
jgi:hypothetical protein